MLVAARAVHFASVMLLFGGIVFAVAVARPALRATGRARAGDDALYRKLLRIGIWSLVASAVSGAIWLGAEAQLMSGLRIEQALGSDTLALVLGKTAFGHLWLLRFGLSIALGVLLVASARTDAEARKVRFMIAALPIAAAYLLSLAWAGHAAAAQGNDRWLEIASDAAHLLAAGAWLGALPGLAMLLGGAPPRTVAVEATRRFSTLGLVSVGALVVTGVVNAWYLVGDVPALFGTEYGRLLLAKLALFTAMVVLAAINRFRLTPRLATADDRALRSLRRNAVLETAAGVAVVTIVGALGITVPGAHAVPVWPFAYTLSLEPVYETVAISTALVFTASVALVATGLARQGFLTRRPGLWVSGLVGIFVAASTIAWLLAVPAYPTTYVASPVPFAVDPIARGAALYRERCSACHGASGHGDGPTASALPIKPTDLATHASHHRGGDLFWWIAHGIPGTPMPGFAPQLSDAQIWEAIAFLHAQSDAESIVNTPNGAEPAQTIEPPDFSFERAGSTQQSLREPGGTRLTLLVLYTLPQSLARLSALAADEARYAAAGARLIAVPRAPETEPPKASSAISAVSSANVGMAYAMYARKAGEEGNEAVAHAELLIDAQGYLRARWIGVPSAGIDRTAEQVSRIRMIVDEPPRPPPREHHGH